MCNPLRQKFEEWREWLLGDDVHSIRNQIHNMIWDSAVYQSINEVRAYAPTDAEGRIELNATVHHFIDRCFFDTQMMAIRRFLDKETRPGDRSVISLWRLLDDMEKHVSSLTRANILACLDLPFDYEKAREDVLRCGVRLMGDHYKQCVLAENVHEYMDTLAGVECAQRAPADTVRTTIIQWLKVKLEGCRAVYRYVNKFLAHSATPESRAQLTDEETKITLGQILQAHEVVCQIAEFVGQNMFLHSIGNPLPIAQFDQFEHFEKPWVKTEGLQRLREWWRSYEDSTNQWLKWDWQSEYGAYGGA